MYRDHFMRTARAPAKLNLYLEVLGRRGDGFHELETLMVPIRLSDWLSMTPTQPAADGQPGPILLDAHTCWPARPPREQQEIPAGSANLIVRALELLRERTGCRLGARVELVKRIPAAAGLGGGSSDAAAALRLADRVWQLHWHPDRLAELAAELGSDVPFFLSSGSAICRGRGERVQRLAGMTPLHFVVVTPPDGLNTADVYRAHDGLPEAPRRSLDAGCGTRDVGLSGRWGDVACWMHNRLEAAAATLSPWVDRLRAMFHELGCLAHQLSGSGSAYFGVCRHAQHARRLASLLRTRQPGLVYASRSYP